MRFRNLCDHKLNFELDGVRYDVEGRSTVEIPDRVAYCVKLHGLPLAEDLPVEAEPETEPSQEKPSRKKN